VFVKGKAIQLILILINLHTIGPVTVLTRQWQRQLLGADLQQVGPDALVGALLGHLLGEARHLVRGLGDVLGALDEGALVPGAAPHQARHLRHQQGHALGGTDDVVTLKRYEDDP